MIYHVIIQPNAEAELDVAYTYRHARAPQAAARWFAEIVEAINSLEQFPARCPLAPERCSAQRVHVDW
jgi:plasmid stabilization system protein ParE